MSGKWRIFRLWAKPNLVKSVVREVDMKTSKQRKQHGEPSFNSVYPGELASCPYADSLAKATHRENTLQSTGEKHLHCVLSGKPEYEPALLTIMSMLKYLRQNEKRPLCPEHQTTMGCFIKYHSTDMFKTLPARGSYSLQHCKHGHLLILGNSCLAFFFDLIKDST